MTGQCKTCGGWIPPLERIYTDEGTFHDRLTCLTGGHFETLVARYGCRCFREPGAESTTPGRAVDTPDAGSPWAPMAGGTPPARPIFPTATQQEWHDHLDEEHRIDLQAVSEHVVRVQF